MDAAQYQLDVNATASGDAPDVYPALNVVMRRDAKENNFKVRNAASTLSGGETRLERLAVMRDRFTS
jgi:hypothetical protein